MFITSIFLFLSFLLCFAMPANAQLDDLQLRLLEERAQIVRWDNIEEVHLANQHEPSYNISWGMHSLWLEPGEFVYMRVPKQQRIRLFHADKPLKPQDFDVFYANGQALFLELSAQQSQKSLFYKPVSDQDWVVKIQRPNTAKEAMEVAVFVSRSVLQRDLVPYRNLMNLGDHSLLVDTDRRSRQQSFWPVKPGEPLHMKLEAARYQLESRLLFAKHDVGINQDYTIKVYLDGEYWRTLSLSTASERKYALQINGKPTLTGELQQSFFDLPPGQHQLRLTSDQPIILRLLQLEDSAWLFPSLNALKPAAQHMLDRYANYEAQPSFWHSKQDELLTLANAPVVRAAQREQASFAIARQNHYREAGLLAQQIMQASAEQRRDAPKVQTVAQQLFGRHSFYRSLHPKDKARYTSFAYRYVQTSSLVAKKQEERNLVVDVRQRDSFLKSLGQAAFYASIPSQQEKAYSYALPKREANSRLRFLLSEETVAQDARYFVQLDDQPIRQLIFDTQAPILAKKANLAEAGLSLLAQQFSGVSTLKGAFAAQRPALELQQVASVELALAPEVKHIRIWAEHASSQALAVQYRSAKPFEMSESAYLQAVQQLGQDHLKDFLASLQQDHVSTSSRDQQDALFALQNQWLMLHMSIRQHAQHFQANISKPYPKTKVQLDWQALYQQADDFMEQKQWLLALENWTHLAKSVQYRHEAALKRIELLQLLSEGYLAEQRMKGLFLYGDKPLQKMAFSLLQQLYFDQHAALTRLASVALMREPSVQHMQLLCDALMAQGQYRHVMLLQLALAKSEQNKAMLARAAWHLDWWQVFEDVVQRMPSKEGNIWRGYRAQNSGEQVQAMRFWRSAGQVGQQLIQTWQAGQHIAQRMQQPANYNPMKTLEQWENWSQPGVKVWKEDKTSVIDFAGVQAIRSQVTGKIMHAYRATPTQTFSMQVMGPARLWLKLRPIHQEKSEGVLNDWLRIQEGEHTEHVLLANNAPSQTLTMIGETSASIGQQENVYYEVGAGLHTIHVQAEKHALLIRPFVLRADIPLSVLPPLTVQTLADSMQPARQLMTNNQCVSMSCVERLQSGEVLALQAKQNQPKSQAHLEALLTYASNKANVGQRIYLKKSPKQQGKVIWHAKSELPTQQQDVRSEITELLWQVEHSKNNTALRVQALALAKRYPNFRESGTLIQRLQADLHWQLLSNVHQSAGLHRSQRQGWKPETPALRIRKTLMPRVSEDSFMVFAYAQQGFAMRNHQAKQFEVDYQALTPEFMAPQQQVLQYSDGKTWMYSLHEAHSLIRIGKGEHALLLGVKKPFANQFIQIKIAEKKAKQRLAVTNQYERVYQVASPEEPIVLKVHGPQWLRVDTYHAGQTASEYHAVAQGWHAIQIGSATDQSLHRIYQLVAKSDTRAVHMTLLQKTDIEPIQRLLPIQKVKKQVLFATQDHFELGGQEDGTWRLGAGVFDQKIQTEDKNSQTNQGVFSEISLSHHFYSEDKRLYQRAMLLGRNQQAGNVLGFKERLDYAPLTWPVNVYFRGSAFLQNPAWSVTARLGMYDQYEWSAKLDQRWGLEVFGRQLSHQRQVMLGMDRDVFSLYKKDHPYGVKVANTWVYRPWLDHMYRAKLFAVSNKNLSPDHFAVQLGWHQMWGNWQTKLQYQFRWFMADVNRANAYANNQIKLDVRGLHWQDKLDRWTWKLRFLHDVNQKASSVQFQLFWHLSQGRALRDFRKGELDFNERYQLTVPEPMR